MSFPLIDLDTGQLLALANGDLMALIAENQERLENN